MPNREDDIEFFKLLLAQELILGKVSLDDALEKMKENIDCDPQDKMKCREFLLLLHQNLS